MTRFLNLTGRTFLLIAVSIGLLLGAAQLSGVLRTSPLQAVVAGLILSIGLARTLSQLRAAIWRDLKAAVLESERSGQFRPNFPENSPLAEVNRLAAALNGAARSISHSQADLDAAYLQFVETMAQALDARDPYTAGHSLRVAEYSYTLAKAMGLSDEEAETIRIAAQLHDIGKIGIPDTVLQKPGQLTPEEYGLIKLHPQIGRKILEKVGRFERLAVGGRAAPRKSRRHGISVRPGGPQSADRRAHRSRRRFVRRNDHHAILSFGVASALRHARNREERRPHVRSAGRQSLPKTNCGRSNRNRRAGSN